VVVATLPRHSQKGTTVEKQTLNDVAKIVYDMLYAIERQQGAMWKMRGQDKKFAQLRKNANEALSELLEHIENAQEQAERNTLTFIFSGNAVSVHNVNGQQTSYQVFDSNEDMEVYRSQIHQDHKIVD
jgi:hypothetical protein